MALASICTPLPTGPAERFCLSLPPGYGGNVARPKVEAAAPWFVRHFQELIDALSETD